MTNPVPYTPASLDDQAASLRLELFQFGDQRLRVDLFVIHICCLHTCRALPLLLLLLLRLLLLLFN